MSIPRDKIPWYPTIDEQVCTNCGICVDFCQNGVYAVHDIRTVVVAPYNCVVGCSNCESLCTPKAIHFPDLEQFVIMLRQLRTQFGP